MTTLAKKMLIIGPAWVGDMVMAQTLFTLLKTRNPNHSLTVLAPDWTRALLQRMPEIDHAIPLPIAHGNLALGVRYRISKELAQEHFDQAIILPNSFKSALIPFLARIPRRTGWLGEYRFGLLNDVRYLDKAKLPLMIQRFMALGLEPGEELPQQQITPSLHVSAEECAETIAKYKLDPEAKPILALCPGAEFGPAKRWPAEYFAEIAREKIIAGWQVWLFGSGKDQQITKQISQICGLPCVDLTGKTSLAEAIDLLSLSQMVVSNDSGLMHIAAALNKPLVVMYGSSSPRFTPPLTDKVKIINLGLACSPCFKRTCPLEHMNCLTQLMPQQVLNAIVELNGS